LPKHSEAAKTKKAPTGIQKIILEVFREAIIDHGEDMPASPNLPGGKGVKRSFIKEIAVKRGVGAESSAKSQATQINRGFISQGLRGHLGGLDMVCRVMETWKHFGNILNLFPRIALLEGGNIGNTSL
jgi:hypothetical protein